MSTNYQVYTPQVYRALYDFDSNGDSRLLNFKKGDQIKKRQNKESQNADDILH